MNNLIFISFISAVSFASFANTSSPYSGQEKREVKTLSQQEISGYLNGKGLGYAKAAELNQFPGPRHVLDLAKELNLSDAQVEQSQALFNVMKMQATTLGKAFVEKEHKLNEFFANSSIDTTKLEVLLTDLGLLEAKIRFVHLNAHLKQKALLTSQQVHLYDQLRGYNVSHQYEHKHTH